MPSSWKNKITISTPASGKRSKRWYRLIKARRSIKLSKQFDKILSSVGILDTDTYQQKLNKVNSQLISEEAKTKP